MMLRSFIFFVSLAFVGYGMSMLLSFFTFSCLHLAFLERGIDSFIYGPLIAGSILTALSNRRRHKEFGWRAIVVSTFSGFVFILAFIMLMISLEEKANAGFIHVMSFLTILIILLINRAYCNYYYSA
ncbi:MAG TPA: hypothetical protein P5077_03520 [bacterium]|nr:hypothetical protein [bacterium]